MDAGRAIREARLEAGLTQTALAERGGTSQATLSAYENGQKQPSVETFSRLLRAAGARLAVEPARVPVVRRSRADHERAARELHQALELAEALPSRPGRVLRFPPRRTTRSRRAA